MTDSVATPSPGGPSLPLAFAGQTTVSQEDLVRIALNAGFPKDQKKLTMAVAISFAENSTHSNIAINVNKDGSHDVGLWQINFESHRNFGSIDALKDPAVNGRAMVEISGSGQTWTPWSTYNNNKYKMFTAIAASVVTSVLNNPTTGVGTNLDAGGVVGESDGLPDVAGELSAIKNAITSVSDFLGALSDPKFLHRSIEVIAGAVLVIVALVILNRDTIAKVANGAKTVGEAAAVAA